ncbi:MAG: hypothetical protein HOE92_05635 [Euryarchaeota archaeon]|nr:hypothetical protein [Euryarchaeota archaeon]MBT3971680.1 hypothetical protein [Euryarchaeota archaeon]MBT4406599.1 hypothetical protein [Euryarchaeota archaeon]
MRTAHLRRDEEAVSAVIGTVLLFAGIVSIIGVMMVSMIPVINDLQGAVEKNGMSGQFEKYSFESVRLSESGMPGDRVEITLDPLDGKLGWDQQNGGMWMSATWQEEQSFRMRSILDLDDLVELRYPGGELGVVCWDDLRLGPARIEKTTIGDYSGKLFVTPSLGLAQNLEPINLELTQGNSQLEGQIVGMGSEVFELPINGESGQAILSTSASTNKLFVRGEGGATVFPPISADPHTGEGENWLVPIPSGKVELHLVSKDSFRIDWKDSRYGDVENREYAIASGGFFDEGASWSKSFDSNEDSVVQLSTSSPAQLLLVIGEEGAGNAPWPSVTGSSQGISFLPPALDGELIVENPSQSAVVVRTLGGALSVAANDTLRISWPPINANGAAWLSADEPIQLHWVPNSDNSNGDRNGSMFFLGATDTGRISGSEFDHIPVTDNGGISSTSYQIFPAGPFVSYSIPNWNIYGNITSPSTNEESAVDLSVISVLFNSSGNGGRILSSSGINGAVVIPHDGFERCVAINVQASGWIKTILPWEDISRAGEKEINSAWKEGTYPSSLRIRIYAEVDDNPSSALATGWAFHLPRLTYTFDTSISGLELATTAGAIMTNYPQVQATAISGPSDRSGPGPRFSATVPIAYPTDDQISGSSAVDVDLTLVRRDQLISSVAFEVRRGWTGPYGGVLAGWSSQDLTHSEDWAIFPQQLQMLNDYKGWVPTPTPNSPETVYHTQGEPIHFSLQISILEHEATGVS